MRKRNMRILAVIFPGLLLTGSSEAQGFDVQQLLLDVQKLSELKSILSEMKSGYETLDRDYSAIRDVAEGNFNLHKVFLDGLLAVSPVVKNYQRAADILNIQGNLVSKYRSAWNYFQQKPGFRPEEILLIGQVYSGLLWDSIQDLNDLGTVVTDGTIRASDAERMRQIDVIYNNMSARIAFFDRFTNSTALLLEQRTGAFQEARTVQNLHGINP